MNNEGHDRRSTDSLLIDLHGMVVRLDQKMDETHRLIAEHGISIKEHETRLKPIEDFHETMRTAGKVGAIVGTPALLGVGAGLWAWVRGLVVHHQ